jgi:hypothetical protein
MRIYVAGPMTGYEHDNAPAFERAATMLRAQGHDVVTPIELNAAIWKARNGTAFDPATSREYGDPILDEMYAEDLRQVCLRRRGRSPPRLREIPRRGW